MLHKSYSRVTAIVAVVAVVFLQCPVRAQELAETAQSALDAGSLAQVEVKTEDKPILIAQACSSCGVELSSAAVIGAVTTTKHKDQSLLTDSLWGNLILEMAYQRDKELGKLARRMGIVNLATMGSISGIAGGTLAQGLVALGTLNPPPGIEDSYVPGAIGVALSSATILTFVARMYFGHKLQKQVRDRQLAIKHSVETILNHLELSNTNCADAQKELKEMIGERACGEWLQLWRSSHQLAMTPSTHSAAPHITLNTSAQPKLALTSAPSPSTPNMVP